jgi:GNAT superfamily N-acetyltransferase
MISIRTMTEADLPLGMRLKEQAGWNQTEADWRRLLTLGPGGCFVAEVDGRPVATTGTCVFDSIAWITMVLVDKSVRGRGIGTRLMQHALKVLDDRGVRTARLDATPLGQPIYEKLGFVAEYPLARWQGMALGGAFSADVGPVTPETLNSICALDRQITATDRRRLIEQLYQRHPEAIQAYTVDGRITGYMAMRPGSKATQIGPIVALDAAAGRALGNAALCCCARQLVFVDVPLDNLSAMQWAESSGLGVQRPFTRMRRGEPICDRPTQLWASFGPEKG